MNRGFWLCLALVWPLGRAACADPPAPIAVSPTDAQWAADNHFAPPAGLALPAGTAPHILGIESLQGDIWNLQGALDAAYGADGYRYSWAWEVRPSYGMARNQIKGVPPDWAGLYTHNVIVDLGASMGQGLSREQRCMLAQWVKDGGGLVILAGYWTYGSGGGWAGTTLDDLAPVNSPATTSLWDWQSQFFPLNGPQPPAYSSELQGRHPVAVPPASPAGVLLSPEGANPITAGMAWEDHPLVMVGAKIAGVKPGAQVLASADGTPVIVIWHYGAGKVVAVLAQPLGEPLPGQVPFWQWRDWPKLLGRIVAWAGTKG